MMDIIKLARHALSGQNTGERDPREIGDRNIPLASKGPRQARRAGKILGPDFIREALIYHSHYLRVTQTLDNILIGAGLTAEGLSIYEDPDLREVDHGYDDVEAQEALREIHGWFDYRFEGGEAPADCYTRVSRVIVSIANQSARKRRGKILVVSHGLTIRLFVMRFMHLKVAQFESLANPHNCDIITIARKHLLTEEPQFSTSRWGVTGLRFREAA